MTNPRLTTLSSLLRIPTLSLPTEDEETIVSEEVPVAVKVARKYVKSGNYQYKKRSIEEWKRECAEVHGNKYDYSEATEQMAHIPLPIICPIHGRFKQRKANHLHGQGCPKCASSQKRLSADTIGQMLAEVNPDVMYVTGYVTVLVPATFMGTKCGHTWKTTPNNVIYHKGKCPICRSATAYIGGRVKSTAAEYQAKLDKKRGNKFLLLSPYRGSQLTSEFKCLMCDHTFLSTPTQMIHGYKKCPHCRAE